ncbi:hypothetical protein EUGRSUZ_K00418 [Eucalyptus grandis]|uniref:Uncharacterized protein n=2 Tax=Eucalyptus grandis TaxID=71139 RepID=A0ACC3IQ80_EUCGR|nr:hypothetical protein EUGRSUZ_K00418 [Eucalyptus grandis]
MRVNFHFDAGSAKAELILKIRINILPSFSIIDRKRLTRQSEESLTLVICLVKVLHYDDRANLNNVTFNSTKDS